MQRYEKASEKYQVYLNIFHSERKYLRESQRYEKASEKYQVYLNILQLALLLYIFIETSYTTRQI